MLQRSCSACDVFLAPSASSLQRCAAGAALQHLLSPAGAATARVWLHLLLALYFPTAVVAVYSVEIECRLNLLSTVDPQLYLALVTAAVLQQDTNRVPNRRGGKCWRSLATGAGLCGSCQMKRRIRTFTPRRGLSCSRWTLMSWVQLASTANNVVCCRIPTACADALYADCDMPTTPVAVRVCAINAA